MKILLTGDKKTKDLANVFGKTPESWPYIYEHLDKLENAGLVVHRSGKWCIPNDKRDELRGGIDPSVLKMYFAGSGSALKVLRKLQYKIPFLMSAGRYWTGEKFLVEKNLEFASEILLDSGAQQFYKKFHGIKYPYSSKEYLSYAKDCGATLFATLDLPLDILNERGLSIRRGIRASVENGTELYHLAEKDGCKGRVVPTLQGLDDPSQWLESYDQFVSQGVSSSIWGIGSICMMKSRNLAQSILQQIRKKVGDRAKIHVFGLALDSLRTVYPNIDSFDTSTWVYWAKMDGACFVWDRLGSRFIHLQARSGKRYDTLSLMRANIEAVSAMVSDFNMRKEVDQLVVTHRGLPDAAEIQS